MGASAAVVAIVAILACEEEGREPTDYGPMLKSVSANLILPAHDSFATKADALATAAAALQTNADDASLAKMQDAWRSTRAAWRSLDAFHFGPVGDLGLTERIDAAPASAQAIEQAVTGNDAIDAAAIAKLPAAAKGFLGLEYLVFARNGDHATLLTGLQGSGAAERRRALVKAMADDIAAAAHQLADAWSTAAGKGAYAKELETAGAGSTRYPTQRAAVDDLVAGGGYALEIIVGVRLAQPLGRTSGGSPDPSKDPTLASDSAVDDMTNTLSNVRAIYQNDGFSSRVRSESAALDDRVNAQLADCQSKITAIPKPFEKSVTDNTGAVNAAYDSCKALKATWNADLTSAIGATLKPPDTDGD